MNNTIKLIALMPSEFPPLSGSFAEDELMRLWKGLFYCMWMSDKPLVQEELAGKIADLTNSFTNPESGKLKVSVISFIISLLIQIGL